MQVEYIFKLNIFASGIYFQMEYICKWNIFASGIYLQVEIICKERATHTSDICSCVCDYYIWTHLQSTKLTTTHCKRLLSLSTYICCTLMLIVILAIVYSKSNCFRNTPHADFSDLTSTLTLVY